MEVEEIFMQNLSALLFYSFLVKKIALKALLTCTNTVPVDLNIKFVSKFNHSFINRGCLHCAIVKVLYGFKEKRAHKVREIQFFLQNVQNVIFKILKMFKNNTKFTRAAC